MVAVKRSTTLENQAGAVQGARYQQLPSVEQALGAAKATDPGFVVVEINEYTLTPKNSVHQLPVGVVFICTTAMPACLHCSPRPQPPASSMRRGSCRPCMT
jgi:hypothetical protein